jgi:hypothetical protein
MKFERINLVFGLVLFVVFLATGFYMKEFFKPNNIDDIAVRLQIRSNHIYILFISFLNILSAKGGAKNDASISKILNYTFRILLLCAGGASVFAFMYEHTGIITDRMLTLVTIILSLTSICLFLIKELIDHKSLKSS